MKQKLLVVFSLLVVLSMVVAQSVSAAPPRQTPEGSGLPPEETLVVSTFGAGDVPTLDPSLAEDTTSIQVGLETFVGLTRLNEVTGAVEPGMAKSWDISKDGKVYTFHLHDDVYWVRFNNATGQVEKVLDDEGKERKVTAHDFVYGIRRTLDPKTGSNYNYVNWDVIKNAKEVAGGSELADKDPLYGKVEEIGVKALDDFTLEVTLVRPAAYFLGIASMWINWALPEWLIAEKKDRWIEAGIMHSYGPYVLKEWIHDSHLILIANPFWPNTMPSVPQPKIKYIFFTMLDESPSFANYEAGLSDVSGVPLTEMDRVKADPVLSKELSITGQFCTYYYGFNVTKPPFDDVNVRKAFSWAIDRTDIVENVTKGEQIPARWFSRPGLTAAPDPAAGDDFGPPVKADPKLAKEFLAKSKYGSADKLPEITLMVNQVEGHVRIAEAIQQMWQETLGVKVNLVTQEWKVYLDTLDQDPPQIFRLGWCYDYPDADNFAKGVFRSDSGNNHTKWKNPKYDQLVDKAGEETDPKKRHDLYVEAEKILVVEDAVIAPIYWYTHVNVTKPWVKRTYSQAGQEAFEKWELVGKGK